MKPKHSPGPPMTLGNMLELRVQNLIALNDACRHQALIDVSRYPAETEVPPFQRRIKCSKCGRRGCTAALEGNAVARRSQGLGNYAARLSLMVSTCSHGAQ